MEGASFVPHEILKRAKALAKGDHPSKAITLIGWQPPPPGFVRLNTYGSVLGNPGQTSAGGVLRDSNGNWIRGFSHNSGITNLLVAELWGLRDRLLLARDLKIRKLIFEIDAKSIVDLLKSKSIGNTDSHPYSALINDCRYLILSFEVASLHHAYWESNFCADLLA
uniref:RNase H type-1 domain-containing protein n=1 Tax=Fagus sylvatica TaxID=28930 RepID=A0A2N9FRC0_FAGSY